MTFKALLEAFAEAKDAERAEWILSEMRDFEVISPLCCRFTRFSNASCDFEALSNFDCWDVLACCCPDHAT